MNSGGEIVVIHNPAAGRRRQRFLAQTQSALAARGVRTRVLATEARGDAERLARDAAAAGTAVIAVAGGDGTINEAINGFAGTKATLALIPLGTANVLAAELGVPASPDAVATIIAAGAARPIHLGEATLPGGGARRFSMMAGVGLDAHVVANLPLGLKRLAGKLAYGWQTFAEWLRLPNRRYRVTVDGIVHDCASAIVAKGHFYAGRFVAAPDAALARDSFELVLFERGGRWAALRCALALALGRLGKTRGVNIVRARAIVIEGAEGEPVHAEGEPVHADGDIVGVLPVRFGIAPETLMVMAPPLPSANLC